MERVKFYCISEFHSLWNGSCLWFIAWSSILWEVVNIFCYITMGISALWKESIVFVVSYRASFPLRMLMFYCIYGIPYFTKTVIFYPNNRKRILRDFSVQCSLGLKWFSFCFLSLIITIMAKIRLIWTHIHIFHSSWEHIYYSPSQTELNTPTIKWSCNSQVKFLILLFGAG